MQGVLDGPPILQCLSFWGSHAIHTAQDVVQLTTAAMELVKKLCVCGYVFVFALYCECLGCL